ncbi:heme-degrading monooxygenase HmoA [Pseudochrobactrum saccharolyticum]|uniref:Heme-degrading monooxygenase HmoA n=1 Tax=Pseudochrobactrum saccharolyticum TaxID=354352 RepID=A0A7W8AJY7_9HYPH|nr:antibiotic biosynthesis monooxygenase [Pseudochrobactrum saccharolyticum]KAB0539305.1 antibiotic biosynthesis monooxygenase [Pseudochrobactrum saccharolyticum]MBB5090656.1 heme-degrading monooxygenase HmoA [Pseudochrobactrum saccharolyticum]
MHNRSPFATLPAAPYYIVAFSSQRTTDDDTGYGEMAGQMVELAEKQDGFLGIESVRDASGFGITNSYWRDEESIRNWKRNVDHLAAQKQGRAAWYETYALRIARVERAYGFNTHGTQAR